MNTEQEFRTIKQLVTRLLKEDVRARNSDKWLTFRVFEEIAKRHGSYIYIPFDLFDKFPAFETVKRVRAKIQNEEELYLPTKESVIRRRKQRQHTISALMAGG